MKFPVYRKQVKTSRKRLYISSQSQFYRNVYLNSDHWKQLRREKLDQIHRCEKCGTKYSLDVHHLNYKGLYDVKLKDLQVLCRPCHTIEHSKPKKISKKERKFRRKQNRTNVGFELSDNWFIRYCLLTWLLRILRKRDQKPTCPTNVKKHREWNKLNPEIKTEWFARSKVYNPMTKIF